MNKRDMQRLMKIDEEIISLEISYERQRQHELLLNKTTLLLSRGIKHRLDSTKKARKVLAKAMINAPARRTMFNAQLQERKRRLDDAIAELPQLIQIEAGAAATLLTDNCDSNIVAFKDAQFEVRRQKSRIAAYDRSYVAFAKRGEMLPVRAERNVLPANYEVEKDAAAIYGQLPIDKEIAGAIRLEDTALANSEGWNINKAANNATLDLITQPRKRPVIDFD